MTAILQSDGSVVYGKMTYASLALFYADQWIETKEKESGPSEPRAIRALREGR